jgi:hypothetical protein
VVQSPRELLQILFKVLVILLLVLHRIMNSDCLWPMIKRILSFLDIRNRVEIVTIAPHLPLPFRLTRLALLEGLNSRLRLPKSGETTRRFLPGPTWNRQHLWCRMVHRKPYFRMALVHLTLVMAPLCLTSERLVSGSREAAFEVRLSESRASAADEALPGLLSFLGCRAYVRALRPFHRSG